MTAFWHRGEEPVPGQHFETKSIQDAEVEPMYKQEARDRANEEQGQVLPLYPEGLLR